MGKASTAKQPRHVSAPSSLERLRFALLRDGPRLPGGRYVGMETAPILPWPHQAVIARRIIATWPYSYLLCDEVGLGKTIEAGLVIRSLHLAGFVRRVLISPPAHLTQQWQREMASKFFLPFGRALTGRPVAHEYLLPCSETRAPEGLYGPDLVIVSTGLFARHQRQRDLRRTRRFDIALIDEAQAARRHNPTEGAHVAPRYGQLYRTIQTLLRPRARCLLLLTATPMQLDPVEVHDLIHLTDRVGPFQQDPGLFNAYYALIGRLARAEELHPLEWQCLHRAVRSLQREDPRLWAFMQTAAIEPAARPAVEEWLASGASTPPDQQAAIKRLAFAAAPLSRVMFRHTRRLLEIYRDRGELKAPLATRVVLPLQPIPFTDPERRLYGELEVYCRGLVQQLGQGLGRHRAHALGFFSSFLRLRFASSLHAIGETLRRRLEHVQGTRAQLRLATSADVALDESMLAAVLEGGEDDERIVSFLLRHRTETDLAWEGERLSQMRSYLDAITGPSSKMVRLLELLGERRLPNGRYRQTVIFTRFYDTLTDIVAQLRDFDRAMLVATYSGRGATTRDPVTDHIMVVEREAITHRFLREAIDILVCTDAAAEGLNLQTADLLINFDLPWNPMTVEQRIGRLDRIGQKHAVVHVCNLCYPGSAEEIVYGRLLERLTEAGYVVGTQQLSLLPVTPDEFRALAEGELSAEELTTVALQRARLAQQRAASMEIPASELYDIYQRLEQSVDCRPPVDLDAVWHTLSGSDYLRAAGCAQLPDAECQAVQLRNVAGIEDGTVLTVSRRAYEEGIPALDGKLRFATYGEPTFEALLDHMATFPLPACIRRLASVSPDAGIETVAYAVACRSASGTTEIRLVTAWHDTADLRIDEEARLTDTDIGHLQEQLQRLARTELDPIRTVTAIEALNRRAGRSQLLLDYLVARGLLVTRQRLGIGCERFWDEFAAMQRQFQHREVIRVPHIPARFGRRLKGLLFEPVLSEHGAEGYIDAPRMLLLSALDAAGRLANGVHGPRAEITVAMVLRRLEQIIAAFV